MKICIENEEVPSYCNNCGEDITINPNKPFLVCLDPGQINYPHEPDEPAELYLVCFDCVGAEMMNHEPGSEE